MLLHTYIFFVKISLWW